MDNFKENKKNINIKNNNNNIINDEILNIKYMNDDSNIVDLRYKNKLLRDKIYNILNKIDDIKNEENNNLNILDDLPINYQISLYKDSINLLNENFNYLENNINYIENIEKKIEKKNEILKNSQNLHNLLIKKNKKLLNDVKNKNLNNEIENKKNIFINNKNEFRLLIKTLNKQNKIINNQIKDIEIINDNINFIKENIEYKKGNIFNIYEEISEININCLNLEEKILKDKKLFENKIFYPCFATTPKIFDHAEFCDFFHLIFVFIFI
jgi:hypothetical protein